jgi:hypothetical protein
MSIMESVFISYNDECDSARANHVRKTLMASGRYQVEGYWPYTSWANNGVGSSLDTIKQNIKDKLAECSVALLLIGPNTAANPWVRYTIQRAHATHKAMLGLLIHEIPDERRETATADINPLERFAVMENGKKIYLSELYRTYKWVEDLGGQFDLWVEQAKVDAAQRNPIDPLGSIRTTDFLQTYGKKVA